MLGDARLAVEFADEMLGMYLCNILGSNINGPCNALINHEINNDHDLFDCVQVALVNN